MTFRLSTAVCRVLGPIAVLSFVHCTSSTPPMRAPDAKRSEPAIAGPTRTDFESIAKELVRRCVAGGWISKWRSGHENIDVAKPKIHLRDFEDRTGQGLDPTYLETVLAQRMRTSGVFEMVSDDSASDFIGRGSLMRLAERDGRGRRTSVYTATLQLIDPSTSNVAYGCEASVAGEL